MAVLKKKRFEKRRSVAALRDLASGAARRLIPVVVLMAFFLAPAGGSESIGHRIQLSDEVRVDEAYMAVRLRGALRLHAMTGVTELSALAWDEDEQVLYALSDNGQLLHLKPVLKNDRLVDLLLLQVLTLRDPQGKPLSGHFRDSEGLTLENGTNGVLSDSRLLISFERHNRISRYTSEGFWDSDVPLPRMLREAGFYRSFNEGLEAVTLHPDFGLLTAPERLADDRPIPIVNLQGQSWLYRPFEKNGAVVALEALPDGSIIVLERAFSSPVEPWVITLSRVRPTTANTASALEAERLVRFDSGEGWRTLNFEGLTAYRNGRFFMISDDGGHLLQSTQLLYIELLSPARSTALDSDP